MEVLSFVYIACMSKEKKTIELNKTQYSIYNINIEASSLLSFPFSKNEYLQVSTIKNPGITSSSFNLESSIHCLNITKPKYGLALSFYNKIYEGTRIRVIDMSRSRGRT